MDPASTDRLRRRYALARRPFPILMLLHSGPERLKSMPPGELRDWREGVEAAIRRERRKGAIAHWSYDLNRHIALKTARDRIAAEIRRRADACA